MIFTKKMRAGFFTACLIAGTFSISLNPFASERDNAQNTQMFSADSGSYDVCNHNSGRMIVSSTIFYNMNYQTDKESCYLPQVSEFITYSDGEKVITPANHVSTRCVQAPDGRQINLNVVTATGSYTRQIPVVTVASISCDSRVSTRKKLSSDRLELTIHYSDGSSRKADKAEISSEVIKKPKEGKNTLTCYYQDTPYPVTVSAYKPAPKVSFDSYGSFTLKKNEAYSVKGASRLTQSMGETYFNNHRETYYSQRVLPGTALDIPGRHVADDGTIRDKDGYICVASDYSFCGKHDVLLTSLGPAKVYDTGCASGTIDIYVDW